MEIQVGSLRVDRRELERLCHRWHIARLEVFGSVLRDDFGPTSDVDLLVTFDPDTRWSLFQLHTAEEEFSDLFGSPVELVSKNGLENSANYLRKRIILESAEVIYAA
ncbi:MAG: nucleotidyltransferase domain-containing protein [Fimbriimonadia bacterium]|nr:nucleotidyltransferase domain-containing protein [Fimbriimonadia bacterium]